VTATYHNHKSKCCLDFRWNFTGIQMSNHNSHF